MCMDGGGWCRVGGEAVFIGLGRVLSRMGFAMEFDEKSMMSSLIELVLSNTFKSSLVAR